MSRMDAADKGLIAGAGLVAAGITGYAIYKAGLLDSLFGGGNSGSCDTGYVWSDAYGTCIPALGSGPGPGPGGDCETEGCCTEGECDPDDYECVDGGCRLIGTIPGQVRQIVVNKTNNHPTRFLEWEYAGGPLAMLSSITGTYTLVEDDPYVQDCILYPIIEYYAVTTNGQRHLIGNELQLRRAGTFPLMASPGLLDVERIEIEIVGLMGSGCWWGTHDPGAKIKSIQGSAVVIL